MDFQNYVSEYFESRTKEDPSAMYDDDLQLLIDLSRQQDLQDRSTRELSVKSMTDEITDGVEQKEQIPSSLTEKSEPATDTAILNQQESSGPIAIDGFNQSGLIEPGIESPRIPNRVESDSDSAQFTRMDESLQIDIEANRQSDNNDAIDNEFNEPDDVRQTEPIEQRGVTVEENPVPGTEFTGRSKSDDSFSDGFRPNDKYIEVRERDIEALRNREPEQLSAKSEERVENVAMNELRRLKDPEPDIDVASRFDQYIPEDFPLDFNEAILHIEQELLTDGETIEIVEAGFQIPELLEIPDFVYQTDPRVSRVSRHMMERERLS